MATFLVTGEFITDHCRDRVFDFDWEDGLRFLSNSVPNITYAQSIEILAGRKAFDGDSRVGCNIVDETSERQKETNRRYGFKYAGIFYERSTKKHWRPYAYVRGWDADDIAEGRIPNRYHPKPAAKMLSSACGGDMAAWGRFRCVAYMDNRIDDNMFYAAIPVPGEPTLIQAVLWRDVRSPPLWWKQVTNPQDAVIEYLAAGESLEERGAHRRVKEEKLFISAMTSVEREEFDKRKQMAIDNGTSIANPEPKQKNLVRDLLEERGLSPETVDGLERALLDVGEYVLPKPTTDVSAAKWAWIDRSGQLWPCRGYMDHIPLAAELCTKFNIAVFNNNPSKSLEDAGWGKVGISNLGDPYAACDRNKRTPAQRQVIKDWLITHKAAGEQISRWINEGDGFDY